MASSGDAAPTRPRVVIVGGGVAGLTLATKLGRNLARRGKIDLILIDENLTHIWKPSLHAFAAGTVNTAEDEIGFLPHSVRWSYAFRLGRLAGVDRQNREIILEAVPDSHGEALAPARRVPYDYLILAIGSISADFGIPGVRENCRFLDTPAQAKALQAELFNACLRLDTGAGPDRGGRLSIAIVGGGATGVELAAELREATAQFARHGFDRLKTPEAVGITLIEAGPRLLPQLPESLSKTVIEELRKQKIAVMTDAKVQEVTSEAIRLQSGESVPAEFRIWAAGITAPPVLGGIEGLQRGSLGRLKVAPTLQALGDERIFVLGDSAECPWEGHDKPVPPRAQAASQQASFMARQMAAVLEGRPLENFQFRDKGALVSIARFTAVGALMGRLLGDVSIEGRLARLAYMSLHQLHSFNVLGIYRTILQNMSRVIAGRVRPRLKLH